MTLFKYEHIPIEESDEPLVELADYGFELDPAHYKCGLSDTPEMYLRKTVAERLAAVRDELAPFVTSLMGSGQAKILKYQGQSSRNSRYQPRYCHFCGQSWPNRISRVHEADMLSRS